MGTIAGTLTDSLGATVGTVTNQAVTAPLAAAGTCDILHLTLGPLDLNLLGLVVHLDRVVLDIAAQQGAGNLLGNLLCAVAGLLDPPTGGGAGGGLSGLLQGIVGLLNQILGEPVEAYTRVFCSTSPRSFRSRSPSRRRPSVEELHGPEPAEREGPPANREGGAVCGRFNGGERI